MACGQVFIKNESNWKWEVDEHACPKKSKINIEFFLTVLLLNILLPGIACIITQSLYSRREMLVIYPSVLKNKKIKGWSKPLFFFYEYDQNNCYSL